MDANKWTVVATVLVSLGACSHDRRDSETPEGMTPASGYQPELPTPSTTNEPSQPGSPEPMNKPQAIPPEGKDVPTPDSRLNPHPSEPSDSPLVARNVADTRAEPAGGGAHGKGGAPGVGGSGAKTGSAGRRAAP
jgi:hypothetical protein